MEYGRMAILNCFHLTDDQVSGNCPEYLMKKEMWVTELTADLTHQEAKKIHIEMTAFAEMRKTLNWSNCAHP
jgi:hypothetical protein